MKALVYEGAWQMPLRELDDPKAGPDDVVIAVDTVGICGSDVHGFMGTTGRRKPPIVMGHEFSGRVASVGSDVSRVRVGDRVVAHPLITCGTCAACRAGLPNVCHNRNGLGISINGAYADAVSVPQRIVYALPDDMTNEQGALVEPLAVAMRAVNLTPLKLMETLVIIGAGTIGLLVLLAARLKGAGTIIMTDMNPHRLEMARGLGADIVIDVSKQDAVEAVRAATGGNGAHAVIEAVGATPTVKQSLLLVRNGGNVTWIGNSAPDVEINMQQVVTRELTIRGSYCFNDEFEHSIEAIRTGRINAMQLVEKVAPLTEGPQIIHDLAKGQLSAVKVLLKP